MSQKRINFSTVINTAFAYFDDVLRNHRIGSSAVFRSTFRVVQITVIDPNHLSADVNRRFQFVSIVHFDQRAQALSSLARS